VVLPQIWDLITEIPKDPEYRLASEYNLVREMLNSAIDRVDDLQGVDEVNYAADPHQLYFSTGSPRASGFESSAR
jgi:hypothetical protein